MSLPSNISYGNVIGQFLAAVADGSDEDKLPDGVAMRGTITFMPSAGYVLDYSASPNPVTIVKTAIVCTLDSEGYLCSPYISAQSPASRGVTLVATDDPDLLPVGWTWTVVFNLTDPSGNRAGFPNQSIEVPTGATVDLTTAANIASSGGVIITKGEKGADGAPGGIDVFKANTFYAAGKYIVSSTGDIVSAKVSFTSGSSYNAADWNPSGLSTTIDLRGFPQRELVSGEDINAIRDPGVYTAPSTTIAGSLVNWPAGTFTGALIVGKSKSGAFTSQEVIALVSTVAPPEHYSRVTRASNNTTWTPWGYRGWTRGPMTDGTNVDTFREMGAWTHSDASLVTGLPADVTSGAITLENVVSAKTGIALQRLWTEDGRLYTRTTKILAGWGGISWNRIGAPAAPTVQVSDAGLSNAVLIQNFTQKMGGRKRLTTASVAFRFDHGLTNFNTLVRPEMESRLFKYSLALCSGQWSRTENLGVTPEMVNAWVVAGLAEIWNHSKDHGSGDNSEASWKAAILDGLTELQTQIPAAAGKIYGFAPPGSAGTDFGGFIDGMTLEQFYNTDGGRFILAHHAVAAGYLATKRVQDGMVRHGMGHITVDAYTLAQVQTHVEQAKTGKTALQIMLHPSKLDTEGSITTATFTSILSYIKSEETAGNIKVLSPYEQLLADVV